MNNTISDLIFYIFLTLCLCFVGFNVGFKVGTRCEQYEVQKIHEEIGIEIVKKTIGDKTTYSYNVIDTKKETRLND